MIVILNYTTISMSIKETPVIFLSDQCCPFPTVIKFATLVSFKF